MSAPWVGVLGGSFDPVHIGHVRIAEAVRSSFALARVVLVPAATPPHKPDVHLAGDRHRLAMLELALSGREGLEVSTVELDRGGVSYTIDTLRYLRDDPDRPLKPLFVLGMDSLIDIATWKDHRELLDEFALVVVDRSGDERTVEAAAGRPPIEVEVGSGTGSGALRRLGRPGVIFRLALAPLDVSSSRIRRRVAAGRDVSGLVPPAVARYIQEARLYGQETSP